MVSRPYVKVQGSGVSHIGKSNYTGKTLRTVLSMYKGSIHVSCDCCHHTARKVCLFFPAHGPWGAQSLVSPSFLLISAPQHWGGCLLPAHSHGCGF